MKPENYDFSGWLTKYNVRCSDGRTIASGAFNECNGKTVPLVWSHNHSDIENVLGRALLESRNEGIYAYCYFNDSSKAQNAKTAVAHGDITAMSVCAGNLVETSSGFVTHGVINEASLCVIGANRSAFIDNIIAHSDDEADEAIIATALDDSLELYHAESTDKQKERTPQQIYEDMSEEEKRAVHAIVGTVLEANGLDVDENGNTVPLEHSESNETLEHSEGGDTMTTHNLFTNEQNIEPKPESKMELLKHSETARRNFITAIRDDAKRFGSLKDSFIAHAEDYGIKDIDTLFPDPKSVTNQPMLLKRNTEWVDVFMAGVTKSPFARIKTVVADITEDEARAKGYIKAKEKKNEVFTLLKRTTDPQTVYKKQKLDRDDVTDITDFDVIAWLKMEMSIMLNEEIARAALVGDGRETMAEDKIKEDHIRPIALDDDKYTIKVTITAESNDDENVVARKFIRGVLKARKNYKGSGTPSMFASEDMISDLLLMEDKNGQPLFRNLNEVANRLRVDKIVPVPDMFGAKDKNEKPIVAVLVSLRDYTIGANAGGKKSMFEDFDIDFNQMKYLMEVRCSGALTLPYSAIAVSLDNKAAF